MSCPVAIEWTVEIFVLSVFCIFGPQGPFFKQWVTPVGASHKLSDRRGCSGTAYWYF